MNTGERRRLIVLSSIAGVLVLLLIAKFTVFNGGGSDSTSATLPPTTLSTAASATTAPSSRSTSPPATFDVFATKNPFEPVIIVTPPTDGSTPPPTDGTTQTTGTSVALLDVFQGQDGTPMAKVQVGSTVYTVSEGDVFATSYRVVSLDAPCGQFLFGDAPFKLCEGEEVIK